MSYCRWSTDQFTCDLYCYQSTEGGWVIRVASNRHVGDCPKVDFGASPEDFAAALKAQHAFLVLAPRQSIGGAFDGETFHEPTLESFRQRLLDLRASGYRFPDAVLAEIQEEIAERDA